MPLSSDGLNARRKLRFEALEPQNRLRSHIEEELNPREQVLGDLGLEEGRL